MAFVVPNPMEPSVARANSLKYRSHIRSNHLGFKAILAFVAITLVAAFFETPRAAKVTRLTFDGLDKERPSWSSDGRFLAFTRRETGGTHIWQYTMERGRPELAKRLTDRASPDFHAVFSPDGTRLLIVTVTQSGTQGNLDIGMVPREGGALKGIVGDHDGKLSHQEWPSWSPDGKRFAYSSTHEGNQEIYTANIEGGDVVRVTQSLGIDEHPCWSPDGKSILFATDRWGGLEIASADVDGSNVKRLTTSPRLDDYPAVSPDGKRFAFLSNRDGNYEIYFANIDGSHPRNLSNHRKRDTMPCWTPDGKGVTFVSERDGGVDLCTVEVGEP